MEDALPVLEIGIVLLAAALTIALSSVGARLFPRRANAETP